MNRGKTLVVSSMVLDRASEVPIHRQIYQAAARAIRDHAVVQNARLPSTRVMARLLGVSRNTVLTAYENLAADGLIEGERGSGMRVRQLSAVNEPTVSNLRRAIRQSGFPARVLSFEDSDGNPLYVRF